MATKKSASNAHGVTNKKKAEAGEIFAAIAMAMHECQDNVHDVENTVITINRIERRYSPWSSKIHTLREIPHKK